MAEPAHALTQIILRWNPEAQNYALILVHRPGCPACPPSEAAEAHIELAAGGASARAGLWRDLWGETGQPRDCPLE